MGEPRGVRAGMGCGQSCERRRPVWRKDWTGLVVGGGGCCHGLDMRWSVLKEGSDGSGAGVEVHVGEHLRVGRPGPDESKGQEERDEVPGS